MAQQRDELDDFKRRVNLTEYAATRGYALDRRGSTRNSAIMRHPDGDKIVVAKDQDGHWIYFSVRDPDDHGSIVDFVQRRQGGTIGDVRKTLRPWTGGNAPATYTRPPASAFMQDLDHISRDMAAVRARYETMRLTGGIHPYLEKVRGMPRHVLSDPRFSDRVRTDDRGNAVFPHFNRDGLCGYEIKNRGFTGFATGGVKGLWASRTGPEDRRLVVAETAIDALSYATVKGQPQTRYVSTAGELNPDQPSLLKAAMENLPDGGQVILALDHDAGGDKIGSRIEAVFLTITRSLFITHDRPPNIGHDWNDVLRSLAVRSGPTTKPSQTR